MSKGRGEASDYCESIQALSRIRPTEGESDCSELGGASPRQLLLHTYPKENTHLYDGYFL